MRPLHTRRLHLNSKGKKWLAKQICDTVVEVHGEISTPISSSPVTTEEVLREVPTPSPLPSSISPMTVMKTEEDEAEREQMALKKEQEYIRHQLGMKDNRKNIPDSTAPQEECHTPTPDEKMKDDTENTKSKCTVTSKLSWWTRTSHFYWKLSNTIHCFPEISINCIKSKIMV
ncbi:hypothetical protein J6590_011019 [Homalodisca vitripennis]|nr:hypothetical protein J6590_011019 [Homalodisca vitripennis]